MDKSEEAAKLMKKANKLLGPSLLDLRLKPDWEAASPLLERAALLFKQSGKMPEALEAFEKAATAQDKQGSPYHAAKQLEAAADLCRQTKQWDRLVEYYKAAADYYVTSGKATAGADCLARGARYVEEYDSESAMTLLWDAIDIYESDTKLANASDAFRLAVSVAIKATMYHNAVDVLMRFASYCERTEAWSSQCRCYLGVVVIHLYAKEPKAAWQVFQDALTVDCFVSSEEAFAADDLFNAYRSGDGEAVSAVVSKKSVFKQLDNQVARLAVKLPQGNMDKMARRLNRVMGRADDQEEDELYAGQGQEQNDDEDLL